MKHYTFSFLRTLTLICLNFFIGSLAHAATYPITPGDDVVGQLITVSAQPGDNLEKIGERYGIGLHEMLEANPRIAMQSNFQGGEQITVPTIYILPPFRKGIVINLPELRLYYFAPDGQSVTTYPVGLGRMAWRTPLTSTYVIKKEVDPTWHVPASIKQYVLEKTGQELPDEVPPGPDNPLGHYAMYLGTKGYLIHGTNQPWSIGRFISSGCIRLHNKDVEQLFQIVDVGTPVHIINYAYKAGWKGNELYFEAQTPMEFDQPESLLNEQSAEAVLNQATQDHNAKIDWTKVDQIAAQQDGIPQGVGLAENPVVNQAALDNNVVDLANTN